MATAPSNGKTLTGTNTGGTITLSGNLSDATTLGALTMNGSGGTLALSGANTYTGATTVSAGTLRVLSAGGLGSVGTHTSGVSVASGAVLDFSMGGTSLSDIGATITLNSTGISNGGALTFSGAGDTVSNAITLNTDTIGGTGSGTLGGVSGAHVLTKLPPVRLSCSCKWQRGGTSLT